jgi:hypothetical protein
MAGTIYSGTYFSGIALSNPATQNPATIAAGAYVANFTTLHSGDAVYGYPGTAWTLANLGAITGTFGDGIQLESGGSVSNAGSITASPRGIEIDAVPGTVVNSGVISGNPGVYLQAGGSVTNTGAISGSLGIEAGLGPAAITNLGTISSSSFGTGISLGDGGAVVNGGTAVPGALITAYNSALAISGLAGTVTNYGTILATGLSFTAGVYLQAGGTVTNHSGALIRAAQAAAVKIDGSGTVVNAGTIANLGSFAAAVVLGNPGSTQAAGNSTLANAGTIGGASGTAVAFYGSGNRLILDPGAVFSGIVNGGTANDVLELASGTGTGTLSGFGTSFAGFGTVTVDAGASWEAAAANTIAAGIVLTDAGTLLNAGVIASTATLFPSGTLSNSGVITGAVMLSTGGTFDNLGYGLVIGAGQIVHGGSGTVLNAGTITGIGTSGAGVFLGAGSTLTNAGTITGASGTAVAFYGSNNRLILDPGNTLGGASTVGGTAATGNTLELAAGTITGTIGSAFYNFGTFQVDASASWLVPGSFAFLDGTIGGGANLTETGPLTFTGSLVNSGTLAASVTLAAGAGLTNRAGGLVSSAGNAVFGSGAGTVLNAGTISGTGASGAGVFLGAGSTLTNAGTISGASGTAVAFYGSGNRLIVDPGAVFSGTVNGGTANDVLDLASGTGTGTLSGLGTNFTGFAAVAVDPGAVWQVSDAPAAPPGFVNDGVIVVGPAGLVFGAVSESGGGSGVIDIGGSGLAEFAGAVAAGQALVFTAPGNAKLDQPGGFAGAVAGFLPGDTLDLAGIVANAASYASGVLTLTDNGAPVAGLNLSTPLGSRASFRLYPDGAGGTNLTVAARPGNIFPGFYPNGIALNNPAVESPPTITASAYVTNVPGRDSVAASAGFAWTVTNDGRIAGPGNGISLAAPGVVLNGGDVSGANGIDLAAGGTIANSGTVTGSVNAGLYMGNGGYILNGTSAAAGALLSGRYGVEIGGYAGSGVLAVNLATIYGTALGFAAGNTVGDTLVNAGTIGGGAGTAIQFGGGNDLLVIDPHAVFIGRVNGGPGANAIELAAGGGAGILLGLGGKFVNFSSIYLDPGAVWHMAGVPAAPPAFANDGRIIVANSHTLALGAVGEDPGLSGVIAVRTGGTLEFTGAVDAAQTVRFTDNTGTVQITDPQDFQATIQGFQAGDTIDVKNVAADGFTYVNGTLTLTSGGNPMATLAVPGNLGASQFALTPDGQGGTDVTAAAGQLFAFTFVYADGEAYYSGTVADNGSLGYAAIVNSSNPTISEPDGTYYLANDGPATTQPSGAVTVESYAVSPPAANAGQTYVPLATSQGQFDGHAGLGSEADQISVNGTLFGFSPSLEFHPLLAS